MAKRSQRTKKRKPKVDIRSTLDEKDVFLKFLDDDKTYPIAEVETSTCRVACPAQVNIKAYLGFIARGEFAKALEIVREHNPLPGICGRVCTHPCESECRRSEHDDPVAICALKRFIADYELKHRRAKIKKIPRTRKETVAIVGSGPAGLTAANDLIRMGYGVTIFEELPVAGGMLVSAIPAYRLPRDIIHSEIEDIIRLGVEIKTNSKIEDFDRLLDEGYDAVFIAIGAHKGLKMRIPGEDDFEGVVDCITFLRAVNLGKKRKPGDKVVVIGGGNSAIDSARSGLRLGAKEVYIVYRRSRAEMPAAEEEIEAAETEGVKIHYLAAPVRIIGKEGRVTQMECVKMKLGEPDKSGRRRPIPIPNSEFIIDCDYIVAAISQKPDLTFLKDDHGFKITKWETFEVDEETMVTNKPGFFAGGDAVTGPNTVIDAIEAGHRAARAINRYLQGLPLKAEPPGRFEERELSIEEFLPEKRRRIRPKKIKIEKRRKTFDEVEAPLSRDEAMEEARRCLRCGPCLDCIACVNECHKRLLGVTAGDERILVRVPYLPKEFPSAERWRGSLAVKNKKLADVTVVPIVAEVDEEFCRGCGKCESVCEYPAVKIEEREGGILVAHVDRLLCRGCGTCVANCPTGAITISYFEDEVIIKKPTDRKIVAYACNWSGYAAAQFADSHGLKIPDEVHLVHLICLGRLGVGHILKAFEHGADGVILLGCPEGECHYLSGNLKAKEMFETAKKLAGQLGIINSRLQFELIRPDEAKRFHKIITEFIARIKGIRPSPLKV